MKLKLEKKNFIPFLQSLMDEYDLFAPVRLADGVSVYKKIDRPEEVDLSMRNTQKPAKEIFFPQSETMFRYEKAGKESRVTSAEEVKRNRILLGARPCDIQAFALIDQVFAGKDYTDIYYLNKRKATTVIGMGCDRPLSTCFCSSLNGGPFHREGSDLFLTDLGESYLVELLTKKEWLFKRINFSKRPPIKSLPWQRGLRRRQRRK